MCKDFQGAQHERSLPQELLYEAFRRISALSLLRLPWRTSMATTADCRSTNLQRHALLDGGLVLHGTLCDGISSCCLCGGARQMCQTTQQGQLSQDACAAPLSS